MSPELHKKIKELEAKMTRKQVIFCREYVFDWNATRAAKKAGYSEHTAGRSGSENLQKPDICAYIDLIQQDLAALSNISATMIVEELKKIAFTTLTDYQDTWLTLKKFEEIPESAKAAISEVSYSEGKKGDKLVKFKLYDKGKAIDSLNKMLGLNAPEKKDLTTNGKEIKSVNLSGVSDKALRELLNSQADKDGTS